MIEVGDRVWVPLVPTPATVIGARPVAEGGTLYHVQFKCGGIDAYLEHNLTKLTPLEMLAEL